MADLVDLTQYTNAIADKKDGKLLYDILDPIQTNQTAVMAKQDVYSDRVQSRTFNAAGLTLGSSSKAKIKIANDVLACVNGTMVLVAAAEVAFTATTHDIADGYINMYVLVTDSAGTVAIRMGTPATTTAGIAGVVPPTIPANTAVIGIVTVSTTGAIFDASTTELDAVTVTDLYYDVVGLWDPNA